MTNNREAPPPQPSRAWVTVRVALSSGASMIAFAVVIGAALTTEGFALSFPMGLVGARGGPVLGAALGLGLSLQTPKAIARSRSAARLSWILRSLPAGRAGALSAWALALLLLASPYALLSVGGLPPLTLSRLGVTGCLATLCFLQCARRRDFWPAIVLPLWPVLTLLAMSHHYPCWQSSNAGWCGHTCDSPAYPSCRDEDFGVPQTSRSEDP